MQTNIRKNYQLTVYACYIGYVVQGIINNINPILFINKIDKKDAVVDDVVNKTFDLFIELGADDDQLEFPVCYTSAVNNTSSLSDDISTQQSGMDNLLNLIIEHIPAPEVDLNGSLQFQPALLSHSGLCPLAGAFLLRSQNVHRNSL